VRSPLAEALAALGRGLAELRVPWYLFGAQAAILYGAARLTGDADVTVRLGKQPAAALAAALEKQGFRLRVRDVEDFVARTRVLPFAHLGSAMPVDVVLAGPGLEEQFMRRRRKRTVEGVRVFVASPEDLVVMKMLAGRGKDEEDVVAILAAQRRLDLRLVRATLRRLERAIDRADLVSRFETLLARSRRTPGR
jgi:hypothetical protein